MYKIRNSCLESKQQRWAIYIRKNIYTIYRYSKFFAQNIQSRYTLRILKNIQYIMYSCLKKYIQYTFRIYFKNYK